MMRVDLRAEVARMPPQEARDYLLDYFDWLFPREDAEWRLDGFRLSPQQHRIARVMWEAKGALVRHGRLAAALWGDRSPDDWPDSHTVPVLISQMRPKLQKAGITITHARGVGYGLRAPEGFVWPWVRVA